MSHWFQWLLKGQRNSPPQLWWQCCMWLCLLFSCISAVKQETCKNLFFCVAVSFIHYILVLYNMWKTSCVYNKTFPVHVFSYAFIYSYSGQLHSSSLSKPLNVCRLSLSHFVSPNPHVKSVAWKYWCVKQYHVLLKRLLWIKIYKPDLCGNKK